ncbi:MAG: carbohydrate ABC transporter permease [Firmicutes bacterium]|nr:carbohydrate ABC transporter permease [Bacillota bacterium]
MAYNKSKIGDWIIVFIFIILILLCIMPVMNVFSRAMSAPEALIRNEVGIFPVGLNFDAFRIVWSDPKYPRALAWTAILTVIVTVLSLTLTVLCAYPFVYKDLKGRKLINIYLIFTMYFGAGMIPTFLWMRTLGLIDHPLVLILPGALSIFNFLLMRSFFYGIPDSLRESAEMDGANPIQVLLKVYLPLSKPALATIALFYAVGRWNSYGDALVFLRRALEWAPIQLLLYNIQQGLQAVDAHLDGGMPTGMAESARTATIVIATVPILIVYPFLQKYFVAGVTLGAVKE